MLKSAVIISQFEEAHSNSLSIRTPGVHAHARLAFNAQNGSSALNDILASSFIIYDDHLSHWHVLCSFRKGEERDDCFKGPFIKDITKTNSHLAHQYAKTIGSRSRCRARARNDFLIDLDTGGMYVAFTNNVTTFDMASSSTATLN